MSVYDRSFSSDTSSEEHFEQQDFSDDKVDEAFAEDDYKSTGLASMLSEAVSSVENYVEGYKIAPEVADKMTEDIKRYGWTDCHCHLDEFSDPEAVLQRAIDAGVTRVCAVSQYETSWPRICVLKSAHPDNVISAYGFHPAPAGQEMTFLKAAARIGFLESSERRKSCNNAAKG